MASSAGTNEDRQARQRKPSTSAPITDFQGPVGPAGISRPKVCFEGEKVLIEKGGEQYSRWVPGTLEEYELTILV